MNEYRGIAERLTKLLSALDEAGESLAAIKVAEAIDLLPASDDKGSLFQIDDE